MSTSWVKYEGQYNMMGEFVPHKPTVQELVGRALKYTCPTCEADTGARCYNTGPMLRGSEVHGRIVHKRKGKKFLKYIVHDARHAKRILVEGA